MECVFGLVGDGFALVVADSSAVHSILVHKSNEDKIMVLDSHKLLGASGEGGDRAQFTEYIQKNVALYQFRNGIPLTTAAAANFTRGELATALRKWCDMMLLEVKLYINDKIFDLAKLLNLVFQNPYAVNILLAGYDKDIGPSLYYIDYIASLHKIEKGAFGYGSYFSLAMMDRHYHSGMTVEEAVDLVDKCIMEIRSRLVVAPPNFVIKIVDKDGAREYAWRESIKDTTGAPTS
ncbi:Proteasome subunit beta type-2-A [Vitis vinifera]|uniref:Proteasome subunit beta n=1 Tax=Vitis vinifera TaxID=29760 RepID=A0A438KGZ1_VITVI|nr:Proteasome subunit beta type-2-A [Vitis vinifera]